MAVSAAEQFVDILLLTGWEMGLVVGAVELVRGESARVNCRRGLR